MTQQPWFNDYRCHFVCFTCRRSAKHLPWLEQPQNFHQVREIKCPHCGGPMHNLGRKFKTPPRHNIKQWRKVRLMWENGWPGYGWDARCITTVRSTRNYIRERPLRIETARRAASQQEQHEKWAKMRKWPNIHIRDK